MTTYREFFDAEGRRLAAEARAVARHQLPVWSARVAGRVAQLIQHPGFRELSVYEDRWAVGLWLDGRIQWFFADDVADVSTAALVGARLQEAKDGRALERRAGQMLHVARTGEDLS